MTSLAPLPNGWTLRADTDTAWSADGTCVHGGSPWRLLRMTPDGADLMRSLLAGDAVDGPDAGALARRLTEAGLAHPVPPADAAVPDLEVVVPAYGRPGLLDRCLTGLGLGDRVVVVDDGSPDPHEVAAVAGRHGARLRRLDRNGGPAVARNAGLAAVAAPVVAFVDSDCVVAGATLSALAGHLTDPRCGAVAPRIRPDDDAGRTLLARFADAASPLDLGDRPGPVRPHGRPPYVPSTVLVARGDAVRAVGGFDAALRYGEDVDLVWRLGDAGWSVRYDPAYVARHREPRSWAGWLRRRFHYGSSAGPLARRHGPRLAGPALAPLLAAPTLPRRLGEPVPREVARAAARRAVTGTASGLVRWAGPVWVPPVLALGRGGGGAPTRVAAVVDGAAYGAGVWWGALRARTAVPLLPRVLAGDVSGSARPSSP